MSHRFREHDGRNWKTEMRTCRSVQIPKFGEFFISVHPGSNITHLVRKGSHHWRHFKLTARFGGLVLSAGEGAAALWSDAVQNSREFRIFKTQIQPPKITLLPPIKTGWRRDRRLIFCQSVKLVCTTSAELEEVLRRREVGFRRQKVDICRNFREI